MDGYTPNGSLAKIVIMLDSLVLFTERRGLQMCQKLIYSRIFCQPVMHFLAGILNVGFCNLDGADL